MKRIEIIAAEHPHVGVVLSPQNASLSGQLRSIGFTCHDAANGEEGAIYDWLLIDPGADAALIASVVERAGAQVPVLRLDHNVSIFALKQAVIALFKPKAA